MLPRDHWQIYDYPVASLDPKGAQHICHSARVGMQFFVGDVERSGLGFIGLPDNCRLIASIRKVPVDAVGGNI